MGNQIKRLCVKLILVLCLSTTYATAEQLELVGTAVIPHVQSENMKYREPANFSLGARVKVFLKNTGSEPLELSSSTLIQMREKTPDELLNEDQWSWHDFPGAYESSFTLPPEALMVWAWNGNHEDWGVGTEAAFRVIQDETALADSKIKIDNPEIYIDAVTFLGDENNPYPNRLIYHVVNHSDSPVTLQNCRLWLPENNASFRALMPQPWQQGSESFPEDGVIPAGDQGGAVVHFDELPLTYTALQARVKLDDGSMADLWAHVRIKKEVFDISGGWVNSNINGQNSLSFEPFLKTLKRMHINTAHIGEVQGYTDNPELYNKYPLKLFNKLANTERYQSDEWLPRVHAVEFLGEPQYGGGTPVPPMKVWQELAPYQKTKLPTTVTHSEERIWRFYSGLSDYPHYDAYRITAPSADYWRDYDRWGGERIGWGAPLETIGDMTRSLRELNRPMPIAYWSQGAHHGWDHYGGRDRTSPTPDELRAQAYHALAARITSLYWFNLSLKSILKFPDLIEPMTHVGREIMLLHDYYLTGNAYHYERIIKNDKPVLDQYVISGPKGALLFAMDLAYKADTDNKRFVFPSERDVSFSFPIPAYLDEPVSLLKVSAHDVKPVSFVMDEKSVRFTSSIENVSIFVLSEEESLKTILETRRQELAEYENAFGFNPANNEDDLNKLKALLQE